MLGYSFVCFHTHCLGNSIHPLFVKHNALGSKILWSLKCPLPLHAHLPFLFPFQLAKRKKKKKSILTLFPASRPCFQRLAHQLPLPQWSGDKKRTFASLWIASHWDFSVTIISVACSVLSQCQFCRNTSASPALTCIWQPGGGLFPTKVNSGLCTDTKCLHTAAIIGVPQWHLVLVMPSVHLLSSRLSLHENVAAV